MVNKLPTEQECPVDNLIMPFIDTHLGAYKALGLTPNMVTTLGLICGLLSAYLISQRRLGAAALIFLLSYYFDCVDGKLARRYNMQTKFGDLYDHAADTTKLLAVMYALLTYNGFRALNTRPWFGLSGKQRLMLLIVGLASALMFVHMGYQEIIYDQAEESWTLQGFKRLVKLDPHPEKTITMTRHFGCGTMIVVTAMTIYLW
jgi:phosphatidylglycerophosphate synthase